MGFIRTSESCEDTSPQLYKSVKMYASFSIVCVVFFLANAIGIYSILSWLLRHGMLTSDDAAPPGTLDQLQLMKFDATLQVFVDAPECSICLAAFKDSDRRDEIRMTRCGHVFHRKCLGNWLKMKRACP